MPATFGHVYVLGRFRLFPPSLTCLTARAAVPAQRQRVRRSLSRPTLPAPTSSPPPPPPPHPPMRCPRTLAQQAQQRVAQRVWVCVGVCEVEAEAGGGRRRRVCGRAGVGGRWVCQDLVLKCGSWSAICSFGVQGKKSDHGTFCVTISLWWMDRDVTLCACTRRGAKLRRGHLKLFFRSRALKPDRDSPWFLLLF
jgi:hypothetical protein